MMILDLMCVIFLVLSSFFMAVAALGVIRFPDLYMRMSPSTSAATLGVIFILLAAITHFNDLGVISRALAIIAFDLLTSPVAAHMIGRAGYLTGVPLWDKTLKDELKGSYDKRTQQLHEGGPIRATGEDVPSAESRINPNSGTDSAPGLQDS